jgi:hypothetical protein
MADSRQLLKMKPAPGSPVPVVIVLQTSVNDAGVFLRQGLAEG